MIFDRQWLFSFDWEYAFSIAGVSVLLLSLAAVLFSRGLRNSPAVRDTMLLSALAACLAVPVVALVVILTGVAVVSWPVSAGTSSDRALRDKQIESGASVAVLPEAGPARAASLPKMRLHPENETNVATGNGRGSPITVDSSRTFEAPAMAAPIIPRIKVMTLVTLAWASGAWLLAGFAFRSVWRASRIRKRAFLPNTSRHLSIAESAAAAVGLRKHPTILESTDVSTPVVIGFRSPAVVLPPWVFETICDDGLQDIFIHEFAHVRRRDQWAVCAQAAARCLFWPVVTIHWLNRELARSREDVCDNFVLAHHDAISYGELLLRLGQLAIRTRPILGTMGILWEGELEGRIVRILDPRTNRATSSSAGAKLLLLSAFLLAGSVLCGTRFVSAQPLRKSSSAAKRFGPAVAQPAQPVPERSPADSSEQNPLRRAPAAAQPVPERAGTDSLGDPLPAGARLRLGTSRFRPPSGVTELALSPDESVVVTVGEQIIVWDAATGKERWRADAGEFVSEFRGTSYGSRAVAFASDSSHFFTPGRGNTAIVWSTSSGEHEILKIDLGAKRGQPSQKGSRSIDVTPDGKKLADGRADGLVVCNRAGDVLFEIVNEAQSPLKFDQNDRLAFFGHYSFGRFSPDGKILAAVTSDRPEEIRLFDVESGVERRTIALASRLVRLAFSPDGKQIATTERDSAVRLYDVDSGKRAWSQVIQLTNPFENYTSAVAFSPDGKVIAAGATDNRIYLVDPSTGEQMAQLTGHAAYPWALAFAASSKLLYSSGWDGAVRRWDVAARKQLALPVGIRATEVVAASPDGQTLAYQDDSGKIRLVDAENATERRTIQLPGTSYSHLKFSPDGRRLAGGGTFGDQVHVAVWNATTGELLYRWDWPKGRDPHCTAESLCFTPDGTRLAAEVFRQSAAYVWDLANGQQIAKLAHQEVYGLSFSPDGKMLATAGWDSIVRFWETDTWAISREFKVAGDGDRRMYMVCYAPEGGLLATAHLDGWVRIWQADEMLLRNEFHVKGRFVYGAMSFSPDGLWLATGAMDGAVELWDASTARRVWDGGRHQSYVYTVGFGRDSRTLVSGGDDGVGYLWDLRPRNNQRAADPARLWDDVAGEDGLVAYQAMWALSDIPDRAVAVLAEKLRPVKSVIDPDLLKEGNTPEESTRLKRLKRLLADKDPSVELAITVRRAVSLLQQLGTPEATRLLENLAEQDPRGDLGRFATAALHRLKIQKP